MPRSPFISVFALVLLAAGCHGSRWARSDPKYAAKYRHHSDNVLQMAKQASDARQVAGRSGAYVGGALRGDPVAAGLQVGVFTYPESRAGMIETRGGLAGLVVEGDRPLSGGGELGVRLQTPTRLAPFVGVGGYGGIVPFSSDGPPGEEDYDWVFAGYPEAGVHFWVTPRLRLTGSISQQFTTGNNATDYTLIGLQLAWMNIHGEPRGIMPARYDQAPSNTPALARPAVEETREPSKPNALPSAAKGPDTARISAYSRLEIPNPTTPAPLSTGGPPNSGDPEAAVAQKELLE